jgi:hypothetical protein
MAASHGCYPPNEIIKREYARAAVMLATLAERLERVDWGQITREGFFGSGFGCRWKILAAGMGGSTAG